MLILTPRHRRFVSLIEKEWEKAKKQEDKEIKRFSASRRRRQWWRKNEKKMIFFGIPMIAVLLVGIAFIVFYVMMLHHQL